MVPEQGMLKSLKPVDFFSSSVVYLIVYFLLQFDNIKVEEAQNNEALNSGKSDLKELLKKKQSLEIEIQSLHSTVTYSYSIISHFTCGSNYSRGV